MKLGFTGTRRGMSARQKDYFRDIITYGRLSADITEFHQGLCIGADEEATAIFESLVPNAEIVCHPPINQKYMSKIMKDHWTVLPPKDYIPRNHDIVDAVDFMIACPVGTIEQQRSGTWATIRYARKVDKPMQIIYPWDPRMN